MEEPISSDLIRGNIDAIILRVLNAGDNYGYEIVKAIGKNSEGKYELKEPSLYTSLKRLEVQGMVQSYWGDQSQGGRRKYYHITQRGKEEYRASVARWNVARDLIDQLIGGKKDHE